MKVFEYGSSPSQLGSIEPNPGNETVQSTEADAVPSGLDPLTEKRRLGPRSSRHSRTKGLVSVGFTPLAGGGETTSRCTFQTVECRPSIVGIVSIATERRTPSRPLVANGAALWLSVRTLGQRDGHAIVFTPSDLGSKP